MSTTFNLKQELIPCGSSPKEHVYLTAIFENESGWLKVLPSSEVGTLLDALSLSLAVCLGVRIVDPHRFMYGDPVDEFGCYGLLCIRSGGLISRQALLILLKIILRPLTSVKITAI